MKKFLKIILTITCYFISILLLWEIISSFKRLDPWGLSFIFYTVPLTLFFIGFLVSAINLTKDFIKKKNK